MSTFEYVVGLVLVVWGLVLFIATPLALAHSRTEHDHGPDCWWCHPHLPGRRREQQ
ncbi:hypothetical protein [Streptomyces sp. NPDC046821]|uniref:hypothetical protein n=1 Tax=Streptomyces sp. NPDC046821 TaxID=3154702 RepID=UPI0033D3A253